MQIEQTAASLAVREQNIEALTELMTNGLAILEEDGTIGSFSSSSERVLGYSQVCRQCAPRIFRRDVSVAQRLYSARVRPRGSSAHIVTITIRSQPSFPPLHFSLQTEQVEVLGRPFESLVVERCLDRYRAYMQRSKDIVSPVCMRGGLPCGLLFLSYSVYAREACQNFPRFHQRR